MIDLKLLWLSRVRAYWQEAARFLKIIVIGYAYLPIVFLFILGMGYKFLFQHAPSFFSIAFFSTFFWTVVLTRGSVRTFLKNPDLIFLLPIEYRMSVYFRLSYWYSFFIESFIITVYFFLIQPLYRFQIYKDSTVVYLFLVVLLLLKGWNLFVDWMEKKWEDPLERRILFFLRMILNGWWSFYWFGLMNWSIWIVLGCTIFLTWFSSRRISVNNYQWFLLFAQEERHRSVLYSFAEWFMDTPSIERQIRTRSVFTYFLKWIPYKASRTYDYLFLRSIIRYNDLFFGFLRFILLSVICLTFIHQMYVSMFFFLLFICLNLFHLMNGWGRLRHRFWFQILPIPSDYIQRSFRRSIGVLLVIHGFVMAVVLLFQYSIPNVLIIVCSCGVVASCLIQMLLKKRVK